MASLQELTLFHEDITQSIPCFLDAPTSESGKSCLHSILSNSEQFLPKMDAVVGLYDKEADRAIQNILM